jgi:hypothetical protein
MEITMATEALDLSRGTAVTIRLPHRLRVLWRAMSIARHRRAAKLFRLLADRNERTMTDVGVNPRREARYDWLAALVQR